MKKGEQEKRRAVYEKMRLTPGEIERCERFASAGSSKTERNIRSGWYAGRYLKKKDEEKLCIYSGEICEPSAICGDCEVLSQKRKGEK